MFALLRLRPTVRAVEPSYEPENVRVASVAVRAPRVPPRAIPEIVEFWREALGMFEVTRVLPERARPVPVRSVKFSPLMMRAVVEAVPNDEYVEDA